MVTGAAVEHTGMHVSAGAASEALKKIYDQFGLQITDQAGANFGFNLRLRASTEIHGCEAEGFVHRHDEVSGAQNSFFRAQRVRECFAKSDADVFDRVVLVDIKVPGCGELQVERPVTRE